MSKEATISKTETLALTEQYCNGTLPCGFYYFTNGKEVYPIHHQQVKGITGVKGVEVVAEVPTYEEYLKLESDSLAKQEGVELVAELEQKVHILEELVREGNELNAKLVGEYLELEKRLKEAENIILLYFKNTQNATYQSLGMNDGYYKKAFIHTVAKEHLEKHGVKNDY
jgi:hypothetical protein